MKPDEAHAFAAEWIAAWNARDLDRVLIHYADAIVFRSPTAQRVVGTGVVRGKAALGAYWRAALLQVPDLQFTLTEVLNGHDAITILYDNQRGQCVAELVVFGSDGRVVESIACYG